MSDSYDAVIIGSGPSGLAAAITLARAGRHVLVVQAKDTVGGCVHSAELTLPGFQHDICSAVYPVAVSSPFFRELPREKYGLQWIHSPFAVAHPLDNGTAVILERSVEATARRLGKDMRAYLTLMNPLVRDWPYLEQDLLRPLRLPRYLHSGHDGVSRLRSNDLRLVQEAHPRPQHPRSSRPGRPKPKLGRGPWTPPPGGVEEEHKYKPRVGVR